MTDSRLASTYGEALQSGLPAARLTSEYAEALQRGSPEARLASEYAEVLVVIEAPAARLTSLYAEVLVPSVAVTNRRRIGVVPLPAPKPRVWRTIDDFNRANGTPLTVASSGQPYDADNGLYTTGSSVRRIRDDLNPASTDKAYVTVVRPANTQVAIDVGARGGGLQLEARRNADGRISLIVDSDGTVRLAVYRTGFGTLGTTTGLTLGSSGSVMLRLSGDQAFVSINDGAEVAVTVAHLTDGEVGIGLSGNFTRLDNLREYV